MQQHFLEICFRNKSNTSFLICFSNFKTHFMNGSIIINMSRIKNCKIALFGEAGVGKSCLVAKLISNKFNSNEEATIGAAFSAYELPIDLDLTVKLEIWDTAGQERYQALAPMYYRNSSAAIIVFDITCKDSYNRAKFWLKEVKEKGPDNCMIALIGNKIDLHQDRQVNRDEVKNFCKRRGILTMETSAIDGTNVRELFREIGEKSPEENGFSIKKETRDRYFLSLSDEDVERKTCCYY